MPARIRDCIAAQICSLQPQGTTLTQSNKVIKIMKSIKIKAVHLPNLELENLMFHFKEY